MALIRMANLRSLALLILICSMLAACGGGVSIAPTGTLHAESTDIGSMGSVLVLGPMYSYMDIRATGISFTTRYFMDKEIYTAISKVATAHSSGSAFYLPNVVMLDYYSTLLNKFDANTLPIAEGTEASLNRERLERLSAALVELCAKVDMDAVLVNEIVLASVDGYGQELLALGQPALDMLRGKLKAPESSMPTPRIYIFSQLIDREGRLLWEGKAEFLRLSKVGTNDEFKDSLKAALAESGLNSRMSVLETLYDRGLYRKTGG